MWVYMYTCLRVYTHVRRCYLDPPEVDILTICAVHERTVLTICAVHERMEVVGLWTVCCLNSTWWASCQNLFFYSLCNEISTAFGYKNIAVYNGIDLTQWNNRLYTKESSYVTRPSFASLCLISIYIMACLQESQTVRHSILFASTSTKEYSP